MLSDASSASRQSIALVGTRLTHMATPLVVSIQYFDDLIDHPFYTPGLGIMVD